MKKDIHPKYKEVTINFQHGGKFKTKSTYEGDYFVQEMLFSNHPAWNNNANQKANKHATKVAAFDQKFAGLSSFTIKKEE